MSKRMILFRIILNKYNDLNKLELTVEQAMFYLPFLDFYIEAKENL